MALPETIDRYSVSEMLNRSRFGAVFRCRDHELGRKVVVKCFNPSCSVGDYPPEVWRARFLMEARALAAADHEFVAPALGFGRNAEGVPYFVMPWYPDSLKRRLGSDKSAPEDVASLPRARRPRRLALEECVRLAEQMLDGLAPVHAAGIVHRDLKPANIMLSARIDRGDQTIGAGDVRIVDFGLCRHPDLRVTRTEGWLGTESYMSPEQRRGVHAADFRADLFAVGVMFYRMLTGALPAGRPAPIDEEFGAPAALQDWLAAMLASEPGDRPESAAAAREGLLSDVAVA